MWCSKNNFSFFFLTLLYIQTTFTSDNTSSFVLNMKPILTLQSTVNTLVANRLDVCSDVVYDWGKCKRSNVSHVCAGRLRVMLVARLGNVKKGDIGTHTHIHTAPFPVTPPAPPLISRFLSPLWLAALCSSHKVHLITRQEHIMAGYNWP